MSRPTSVFTSVLKRLLMSVLKRPSTSSLTSIFISINHFFNLILPPRLDRAEDYPSTLIRVIGLIYFNYLLFLVYIFTLLGR